MQKKELLKKSIENLPFSEELKSILKLHNISTLGELLELPLYDWHKKIIGFNYHDQHEVVSYLMKNDLYDVLKED
jgi:hypothetical protein